MTGMRVLAAMSGGVDSAVAAARAADAGHEVTGVHLALSANPASHRTGARGCCSLEDSRDARRAADVLGIPFYIWDMAERFDAEVVTSFVADYAAGRTPNPCVRCNERIKFAALLDRALALGFDAVVTGHHARLAHETPDDPDGPDGPRLLRSVDRAKDQSYVLGTLHPRQLRRALFPLGDSTKQQVRAEAARRGLAVADKPDSHDICFIADGDTAGYLRRRLGARPGPIVDRDGTVLGGHDGAFSYTVGQRRGLRLGRPAADGRPRYVLGVDPVSRVVAVGPAEALEVCRIDAEDSTYPGPDRACRAQLRAHGASTPARAVPGPGGALAVEFARPVRGVAPGQAVVLYDEADELVLGGATISGVPSAAGPMAQAGR